MFPSSLLAKLLVRGSLKNTGKGFELKLKNIIDSGTIVGMGPLVVDETTYQPSEMTVKVGTVEMKGDQISRTAAVSVRAYAEIWMNVDGAALQPGDHAITIQFLTREVGRLQFSVTEPLSVE